MPIPCRVRRRHLSSGWLGSAPGGRGGSQRGLRLGQPSLRISSRSMPRAANRVRRSTATPAIISAAALAKRASSLIPLSCFPVPRKQSIPVVIRQCPPTFDQPVPLRPGEAQPFVREAIAETGRKRLPYRAAFASMSRGGPAVAFLSAVSPPAASMTALSSPVSRARRFRRRRYSSVATAMACSQSALVGPPSDGGLRRRRKWRRLAPYKRFPIQGTSFEDPSCNSEPRSE